MGNRLSRIATRTGDDGTTGLADGSRAAKDSSRITALGEVDELNSHIGVIATFALPGDVRELLRTVQHQLFDIGAELSVPGSKKVGEGYVSDLDAALERLNAPLPPLREFILPGGCPAAAAAHVARTACRRAERALVSLAQEEEVSVPTRQYLNRLSDLLFVTARVLNRAAGVEDPYWKPKPAPAPGNAA
jgi:cob(I)alamin adenosyltransferase